METKLDLDKFSLLVKELKEAGLNEALAKVIAYEKLKSENTTEVYSPFETINS